MWEYRGQTRPQFAEEPGPGQESVWDYPRPPAIAPDNRHVRVESRGQVIADTHAAIRILETASPPGFYIPPEDIRSDRLVAIGGSSYCEWKGQASYWALADDARREPIAWSYAEPRAPFGEIAAYLSFYAGRVECYVDGERVRPQPGGFYGGWLTDDIVGPVKGEPGTGHW